MKTLVSCFILLSSFEFNLSFPVGRSDSGLILIPLSALRLNNQPRGPLDFIGNWIQSSSFFPIEINIPDTFSAVGNTIGGWASNVGNFAQNVGSTLQGVTQNVGNGIQSFAQGLTQNVPLVGAFVRPNGSATQRIFILIPQRNDRGNFDSGYDAMDIFP
ncbi:uncharacterized protein LOC130902741 [Diorhabda carinulata]|uniref:uncharacterized protein LOC130902741 n=1 Tax=Diorhabda carinulata TaxID=1163345 RepID=UPI00259FF480|nr:uncharacterized protein LOC130902741 [Diorhabda carinulata]